MSANRITSKSIILWSIFSIIGIAIIAGVTTYLLHLAIPQKAAVQSAKEATGLFTQYAPDYIGSQYKKVEAPTNTTIRYAASGTHTYDLYLAASSDVQYARTTTATKDNDATAVAKYETLLQQYGLKQTASNSSVTGYLTKLFENSKVACQTDNWQGYTGRAASYGLACVETADVDKAYTSTDALLAKATSDVKTSDIRLVNSTFATLAPTKQLNSLVTKQADGTSLTLYFLNTGKGWEYIGMRPTPSTDDKNSFVIPDKLTKAIQASPDKDLLTKYILRSSM